MWYRLNLALCGIWVNVGSSYQVDSPDRVSAFSAQLGSCVSSGQWVFFSHWVIYSFILALCELIPLLNALLLNEEGSRREEWKTVLFFCFCFGNHFPSVVSPAASFILLYSEVYCPCSICFHIYVIQLVHPNWKPKQTENRLPSHNCFTLMSPACLCREAKVNPCGKLSPQGLWREFASLLKNVVRLQISRPQNDQKWICCSQHNISSGCYWHCHHSISANCGPHANHCQPYRQCCTAPCWFTTCIFSRFVFAICV